MAPWRRTGARSIVDAARVIDFSIGDTGVSTAFSIPADGIGTGETAMRPVSRSDGPAIRRSGDSESDGVAAGSGVGVAVASVGCGGAGSDTASDGWPHAGALSNRTRPNPPQHRAPSTITTSPLAPMPNLYTSCSVARAVPAAQPSVVIAEPAHLGRTVEVEEETETEVDRAVLDELARRVREGLRLLERLDGPHREE